MFCTTKASKKEDGEDTKLETITVVLDQDTTHKVCPYKFDVTETFLKMQEQSRLLSCSARYEKEIEEA